MALSPFVDAFQEPGRRKGFRNACNPYPTGIPAIQGILSSDMPSAAIVLSLKKNRWIPGISLMPDIDFEATRARVLSLYRQEFY